MSLMEQKKYQSIIDKLDESQHYLLEENKKIIILLFKEYTINVIPK